jgi:hypothetical protein
VFGKSYKIVKLLKFCITIVRCAVKICYNYLLPIAIDSIEPVAGVACASHVALCRFTLGFVAANHLLIYIYIYIYIFIYIFINCNWVVTRWQYTFKYKQYIEQHK